MIGPEAALSSEDQEALAAILPPGEHFDSEFAFYLHATVLFKNVSVVCHEVVFAQSAISVALDGDTGLLWGTVIKGYIDLGQYANAYAALMASPHERR